MGPIEWISDASLRRRACRSERSLAAEFAHLAAELARAASREYLLSSQTIPAGGDNATFDHQPHRCIAVADIKDLLAGREMPGRTTRSAARIAADWVSASGRFGLFGLRAAYAVSLYLCFRLRRSVPIAIAPTDD